MSFSVIIPSRNASNLLSCVAAVRKHEPDAQIIVIDDGVDWSEGFPWKWKGQDTLVPGIKPFVFARNVNLGIQAALGRKVDVTTHSDAEPRFVYVPETDIQRVDSVVILNDDALLETPGGFSLLAHTAEEHPKYGIIASTCNNVGNRNQWRQAQSTGWVGLPPPLGLRDEPRMVCFVAVLIPRRTIERVGLLDEEFVKYGMDDDSYCLRVRRAGLKIGIHDGCYVDHGSLTSSFRGVAGAGGDFRENLRIFIRKYGFDNWERPRETSEFPELFP